VSNKLIDPVKNLLQGQIICCERGLGITITKLNKGRLSVVY
jgi:hypothetical protein